MKRFGRTACCFMEQYTGRVCSVLKLAIGKKITLFRRNNQVLLLLFPIVPKRLLALQLVLSLERSVLIDCFSVYDSKGDDIGEVVHFVLMATTNTRDTGKDVEIIQHKGHWEFLLDSINYLMPC